ncbi:E3 ubiquitin-protein ligase SINA 10 [Spatholobus suberectus]|nr:E3 ubiquitin-protein ligase SINA 10 [Spatholobus suberectus]
MVNQRVEHVMTERLRKKKKRKKEVLVPRPACSWVYFSKEFIKEYIASHPESSGLKAATKAASNAWKSMSLEEKEKYARCAGEVWDGYLSSGAAPAPSHGNNISLEGSSASVPTIVPYLFSWGEEEIAGREKREKELGGYGSGELASKKRCCHMEFSDYRDHPDGPPITTESTRIRHGPLRRPESNEEGILDFPRSRTVLSDVDLVVKSIEAPCRNREYGCNETVDYMTSNDHEVTCICSPCTCPLQDCNYVGSFEQLALHFSSKHWDSGRRFKYDHPLAISLQTDEQFLVLQAEEDGVLFLLNKDTETNGNTVIITCIGPSSSKGRFIYEIISCRGRSSLRLKSVAEIFPGRMEDFPPVDFLLIPFNFLVSSRELNIDICIWNSTEHNVDCS